MQRRWDMQRLYNGYNSGVIQASSFRAYHTPLNKQSDYVNSMRAARDFSSRASNSLKMQIFPYSVFYIFFEQYLDIWRTTLINISIGLGAVFIVSLVLICWYDGVMAILGIQLNAVSVVNLVMAVGIAVEFCVHIVHSFSVVLSICVPPSRYVLVKRREHNPTTSAEMN